MAYLRYSFAVDGDRVAINEATQPSGIISMQSGYPSPYSLIPTNPLAKKIERTKFNQLMYLVTSEIRQYQQFGTPNFITSGENGGVNYEYAKGSRIVESGVLYESLIDANTDARSVITSWMPVNAIGQGALGQCQLTIDSGDLLLMPFNGNKLMIDGINYHVNSSGIRLASTGSSALSVYFIYAFIDSGALALEYSNTLYSVDATTGIKIKDGDSAYTLVGMARTDGSSNWQLSRSWYNDTPYVATSYFTADRNTNNTSGFTELNSEIRVEFLSWEGQKINATMNGACLFNVSGSNDGYAYFGIAIDGASITDNASSVVGAFSVDNHGDQAWNSSSIRLVADSLAEGFHYATIAGIVIMTTGTGGAIYFNGSATSGRRTTLTVSCGV